MSADRGIGYRAMISLASASFSGVSRAISDRLREVVGADVVPEHLPRKFLANHQRRAGKAYKGGVRQRAAHVRRELIILTAVRLVSDDDNVPSLRQHWHGFATVGAERG
jgi:vacuolar-type H+-ATPase catalytic subunit A/Vma1